MGNCLVAEEKVIRVMEPGGKILEYQPPINVQQVLSNFSSHALSDSFSSFCHLRHDAKLLSGKLYYLVPLPSPSKKGKKKVWFSNPEVYNNDDQENPGGVVRIKLIISKQELQELLEKGGVSAKDMVSQIQSKQNTSDVN
ncbi:fus3-complementing family protein [Hibiscus syriacus]|uniref:Fus3-complementing family protein n=1 Tax=Hibiscus syriacus TaxID=106335 RepID=A0A6A2WX49_HIBSY|nr:fus3-complementing family protein [Hibiscus syriacus]